MKVKVAISQSVPFPEAQIRSAISEWWRSEVEKDGDDPFAKDKQTTGTLYDLLPTIDSLSAVNCLLTIESCVGIALPAALVKQGGYSTREEMIDHLLPRIKKLLEKTRR